MQWAMDDAGGLSSTISRTPIPMVRSATSGGSASSSSRTSDRMSAVQEVCIGDQQVCMRASGRHRPQAAAGHGRHGPSGR
jgi:hypothetical protein